MISQFPYFASAVGANVEPIDTYLADPITTTGMITGQALSASCNRAWRGSSMASATIAAYINSLLNVDCMDDGLLQVILSNFATSVNKATYVEDTSTVVNVMNANLPIAPLALTDGMVISIVPKITNTTSVTLNLNGLGVKPVISNNGILLGGELIAGSGFQLIYLTSKSSWLLLNYQTTCITRGLGDNSNKLASTAYVTNGFAPLASPALTATPTSTTPPFGDNSTRIATTAFVQSAAVPPFASGTRMLFAQASAPTGWTMDVSDIANNRLLRVVNNTTTGTGNAVGGTHDSWYCNVVPAHTHVVTTGNNSVGHNHTDAGHTHGYWRWSSWQPQSGSSTPCWYLNFKDQTDLGYANLGANSASHTHSGSTDNGSSATNWTPRYTNLIICQKN